MKYSFLFSQMYLSLLLLAGCIVIVNSKANSNKHLPSQEESDVRAATNRSAVPDTSAFTSSPCTLTTVVGGVFVDCSHRSISTIDPSWFPENTLKIRLDLNNLETIRDGVFSNLSKLENLNLYGNRISKLEPNAFNGLDNLTVLNLEDNRLQLTSKSFPSNLFLPLKNLRTLKLKQSNNPVSNSYPSGFVFNLTNLEYLSINGIGEVLQIGVEFCIFKDLKYLKISGYFRTVSNETFSKLSCIDQRLTLWIRGTENSYAFDADALAPLDKGPIQLYLSNLYIGVQKTLAVLKPLQGSKMDAITFESTSLSPWDSFKGITTLDSVVTNLSTKYLKNICVERLALVHSDIFVIEQGAFSGGLFDACLKKLDLSGNYIYGSYMAIIYILHLKNLEQLVYVEEDTLYQRHIKSDSKASSHILSNTLENKKRAGQTLFGGLNTTMHTKTNPLMFPPSWFLGRNLRRIDIQLKGARASNPAATNYSFIGAGNLTTFVCTSCAFNVLSAKVSGMQNIKHLDFSHSFLSEISERYFDRFPSIEKLILRDVALDPIFMSKQSAHLFKLLLNLTTLDMSNNNLALIEDQSFAQNERLEQINLSNNRFKAVPFNMISTPNLKYLDLTNNAISSLSAEEMSDLDTKASLIPSMRLLLSGNIMSCGCADIKYLHWLRNTKVQLDNNGIYSCIDKNGKIVSTNDYDDLKILWRLCVGEIYFWASMFLLTSMMVGFLFVALAMRYSNFYKAFLFNVIKGQFRFKRRQDYQYGVYLGYAANDHWFPCHIVRAYLEESLGDTVCLADRDFPVNQDMATSIMEGIHRSWRTVLVITEDFLRRDQWSEFTMKYSVYAQGPENPSRIVVIVEDRLRHLIPTQLLGVVSDENIVSLPQLRMCYELGQRLKFLVSSK